MTLKEAIKADELITDLFDAGKQLKKWRLDRIYATI